MIQRENASLNTMEQPETYLAWPQARPLLGNVSRTTAWKGAKEGWMPAPKVISPGRRAYALSDILAWQASRGATA